MVLRVLAVPRPVTADWHSLPTAELALSCVPATGAGRESEDPHAGEPGPPEAEALAAAAGPEKLSADMMPRDAVVDLWLLDLDPVAAAQAAAGPLERGQRSRRKPQWMRHTVDPSAGGWWNGVERGGLVGLCGQLGRWAGGGKGGWVGVGGSCMLGGAGAVSACAANQALAPSSRRPCFLPVPRGKLPWAWGERAACAPFFRKHLRARVARLMLPRLCSGVQCWLASSCGSWRRSQPPPASGARRTSTKGAAGAPHCTLSSGPATPTYPHFLQAVQLCPVSSRSRWAPRMAHPSAGLRMSSAPVLRARLRPAQPLHMTRLLQPMSKAQHCTAGACCGPCTQASCRPALLLRSLQGWQEAQERPGSQAAPCGNGGRAGLEPGQEVGGPEPRSWP